MFPDDVTAQLSVDAPTSADQVDRQPTWTAPTITRLAVTRSLAGSGQAADGAVQYNATTP